MKTLLATVLAVLFWIPFVQASPIDDASQYSVRIKSTVRYAFAGENAGTSDGAGFLIDRQRGWDAAAANECVSPSIEIVNKNKSFRGEPTHICISNETARGLECVLKATAWKETYSFIFDGDSLVLLPKQRNEKAPLLAEFLETIVREDEILGQLPPSPYGPHVRINRYDLTMRHDLITGKGKCQVQAVSHLISKIPKAPKAKKAIKQF